MFLQIIYSLVQLFRLVFQGTHTGFHKLHTTVQSFCIVVQNIHTTQQTVQAPVPLAHTPVSKLRTDFYFSIPMYKNPIQLYKTVGNSSKSIVQTNEGSVFTLQYFRTGFSKLGKRLQEWC